MRDEQGADTSIAEVYIQGSGLLCSSGGRKEFISKGIVLAREIGLSCYKLG